MTDFKWAVVEQLSPLTVVLDGTTVPVPALRPNHITVAAEQRVIVAWIPPSTIIQAAF